MSKKKSIKQNNNTSDDESDNSDSIKSKEELLRERNSRKIKCNKCHSTIMYVSRHVHFKTKKCARIYKERIENGGVIIPKFTMLKIDDAVSEPENNDENEIIESDSDSETPEPKEPELVRCEKCHAFIRPCSTWKHRQSKKCERTYKERMEIKKQKNTKIK
jgi:hypothetical protein